MCRLYLFLALKLELLKFYLDCSEAVASEHLK